MLGSQPVRVADVDGIAERGGVEHLQHAQLEEELVLLAEAVSYASVQPREAVAGLAPGVELALVAVVEASGVFVIFDGDVAIELHEPGRDAGVAAQAVSRER